MICSIFHLLVGPLFPALTTSWEQKASPDPAHVIFVLLQSTFREPQLIWHQYPTQCMMVYEHTMNTGWCVMVRLWRTGGVLLHPAAPLVLTSRPDKHPLEWTPDPQ